MTAGAENPFEAYDLDPLAGPEAITDRLRDLAADATAEERAKIREAWQALTLHPLRRLRAALAAHPETRVPLPPVEVRAPAGAEDLVLEDLLLLPSVERALGDPSGELLDDGEAVPLELDPVLVGGTRP